MNGSSLSLYHALANRYDAIYSWKDYGAEAPRLEAIARRYGRSGRTSWLDVACGTGRHLEFLRRSHPCAGVDGSKEMLRLARKRLPGVRLVRGDMRSFHLKHRFDVVSCLFSAIGSLKTEAEVRETFTNLVRHLNPGGVVVVEPWIDPSDFRPRTVHLVTHQGPDGTVVRLASSSRRGNLSVIRYHYLVGAPRSGVRYHSETDEGIMVPRERLVRLLEQSGVKARFLARGLTGRRGLLVGVMAEARATRSPRSRPTGSPRPSAPRRRR